MPHSALFQELQNVATEQRNANTTHIDTASTAEILQLINAEDQIIPGVVATQIPFLTEAVDILVETFKRGGRLFYVGAGTSGRLGVLDASECPPTYGVSAEMVQGIIAGGDFAIRNPVEGAEDNPENGAKALDEHGVTANDVVCGIAASQRTPFVVGALKHAKNHIGAKTFFVTCVPRKDLSVNVDVAICLAVGAEPVMGSTRMKSGTAQKLALNMLTTASMIRLGKVYENMMVDLQMTNQKLAERAKRVLMTATDIDYERATEVLALANGHVKTAILMELASLDAITASAELTKADGFIRIALNNVSRETL
jgi:N-acetylmuramic acid 6-phosphate etherase